MMKRTIAMLCCAVMLLAGCGREVQTEMSDDTQVTEMNEMNLQTVYRFSDDTYQPQYLAYYDANMQWTQNAKKVEDKVQAEVNEIAEDLCNFLNNDLDADWKVEPIEAYATNVTKAFEQQTTTITYGACYYEYKIFVDEAFLAKGLDNQAQYIIAHELIHYLYHLNNGDETFAIYEQERYCGWYLNEAVVDALARRYIVNRHPEMKEENDESSYHLIRLFVDLLQIEIPVFQYFFRSDIEGLKEAVDKHVEQYVICEGSPFEKMVSMMNEITTVKELQSDRASAIMPLLAVTTSSKHADEFLNKSKEEGLEGIDGFVEVMY